MANRGRPNAYKNNVKPRFNEIREWLELGATDKEIAENLGIHKGTMAKYKSEYSEFNELIKNGRKKPVLAIKKAMLKRALGFQYQETKVTKQKIIIDGDDGEKIPAKVIREEVVTRTALPSEAAGLILLQHWDLNPDGSVRWSRDPANREIKKEELELKKKQVEENSW